MRSILEPLPRNLDVSPESGGRVTINLEPAGVLDIRVTFPRGLTQMYLTETEGRHLHLWLTAALLALTAGNVPPADLEIQGWQHGTLSLRTSGDRPDITLEVQDAHEPTSAAVGLSLPEAGQLHLHLTAVLLGAGHL